MRRFKSLLLIPSTSLHAGDHGDPPATRRLDYGLVIWQLLWRMRLDLLVWALICGLAFLRDRQPPIQTVTPLGLSVLGIAVSVFIAFRNTQAISRWWEARSLWGALVNHSRQWRDTLLAYLTTQQIGSARGRCLLEFQVAQAWLLNFELRNYWRQDVRGAIEALLSDLHLPVAISLQDLCRHRAMAIQSLHRDGWVDDWGRNRLVIIADQCLDAIGGLEKIRNTPLPASYDVFVRLISWLYGLQLLLEFRGRSSIVVGAVLFLGFLVAERIGAYVEGPFDRDGSSFSLPLNAFCSLISKDLMQRDLDFRDFRPSHDPARWD